jgi:hypothetical protein
VPLSVGNLQMVELCEGLMLAMMLEAGVVQGRLRCESCHVCLDCCCKGVVDGVLCWLSVVFAQVGKEMGMGIGVPEGI